MQTYAVRFVKRVFKYLKLFIVLQIVLREADVCHNAAVAVVLQLCRGEFVCVVKTVQQFFGLVFTVRRREFNALVIRGKIRQLRLLGSFALYAFKRFCLLFRFEKRIGIDYERVRRVRVVFKHIHPQIRVIAFHRVVVGGYEQNDAFLQIEYYFPLARAAVREAVRRVRRGVVQALRLVSYIALHIVAARVKKHNEIRIVVNAEFSLRQRQGHIRIEAVRRIGVVSGRQEIDFQTCPDVFRRNVIQI